VVLPLSGHHDCDDIHIDFARGARYARYERALCVEQGAAGDDRVLDREDLCDDASRRAPPVHSESAMCPPVMVLHSSRRRVGARARRLIIASAMLTAITAPDLRAQGGVGRVGADSSTRAHRYVHDVLYGSLLGVAYAGVDQLRNDPPEWGHGWRGYERRLASDVGEFVLQETVTEALAAGMHRPLDYQRCQCRTTGSRIAWALASSVTDPLPHGRRALAVPRIVGAYAGSFAQAAWRPATTTGRTTTALINGSVSLLIGTGINLFYELRPHR